MQGHRGTSGEINFIDVSVNNSISERIKFQKPDVSTIEIPVRKYKITKYSIKNMLADYVWPARGSLKVELLDGGGDSPSGNVIYSKIFSADSISNKVDVINLDLRNLSLDINKYYWLTFSLFDDSGRGYKKFNIFNIVKNSLTAGSINSASPLRFRQPLGDWQADSDNSILLKYIVYGSNNASETVTTALKDGTYVFSGNPAYINEVIRSKVTNLGQVGRAYVIGIQRH